MTGTGVAVANIDALLPLFPEDMRETVKLDPAEASTKLSGVSGAFRPLPYSAVGVRGLLLTFRPDGLVINGKSVKNPRIALSPTPLTGDGGWEILM
jgi:hypothetical protein